MVEVHWTFKIKIHSKTVFKTKEIMEIITNALADMVDITDAQIEEVF